MEKTHITLKKNRLLKLGVYVIRVAMRDMKMKISRANIDK